MINSISFSGYLVQDPVVRSPQDSNDTFITFSVCVHFANGEEFINCCSNGDDAKYLAQNAKKGDRVSVSGRLKLNKWTNRSGEAIQKLGVQTYGVEWAPKGAVANMQQSQPQQEYPQRPQTQQAAPRPQQSYNGPQAAPEPPAFRNSAPLYQEACRSGQQQRPNAYDENGRFIPAHFDY
jgi:single-stranded DNA-binding protein